MKIEIMKTYPCRNGQRATIVAFDIDQQVFVARVRELGTGSLRYYAIDPVCAEKFHYGMAVNGLTRDYDILGAEISKFGEGWTVFSRGNQTLDFFVYSEYDEDYPFDLGENWGVEEQKLFYLGSDDPIEELKTFGFEIVEEFQDD